MTVEPIYETFEDIVNGRGAWHEVYDALEAADKPLSLFTLRDRTNYAHTELQRIVPRMEDAGIVVHTTNGYRLADEPQRLAGFHFTDDG